VISQVREHFALLHDARGDDAGTSLFFSQLVSTYHCIDPADFARVFDQIANAHSTLLLLVDYEWGLKQAGLREARESGRLSIYAFRNVERLSSAEAFELLRSRQLPKSLNGIFALEETVSESEHRDAIAEIHDAIRRGETYQVNFTLPIRFEWVGDPIAIYLQLVEAQPVEFGCIAHLPDRDWIVSLSPELFFRQTGSEIEARPMKGTNRRGRNIEEDAAAHEWLRRDPKNRAENLMITDLLRNDLGRISTVGSVSVTELFGIVTLPTVHQMVSTIRSRLLSDIGMAGLMQALFPCGSITGAPKHQTMKVIARLERHVRGLYTGAIGWASTRRSTIAEPESQSCFSVAIRTLLLKPDGSGRMGVGGGITIDSTAQDEWNEVQLKSSFLRRAKLQVGLIETLHVDSDGPRRLDLHLERLERSAHNFGMTFDRNGVNDRVSSELRSIAPRKSTYLMRLELAANGAISCSFRPLELPTERVRVRLRPDLRSRAELQLARWKTNYRPTYTAELANAIQSDYFDFVFYDNQGYVVEGTRTNVFYKRGGRWFTPPVTQPILPGIYRSLMLSDPTVAAVERPLHLSELAEVEDWFVCNSARERMFATVDALGAGFGEAQ
jgi:para-aminobenzoate synthetase/4-amino-4-deoxychorismate lyase